MSLDYLIELLNKTRVTSTRVIFVEKGIFVNGKDREPRKDTEARIEISYKARFASSYSTTRYNSMYVFGFKDYYRLGKSELLQQARKNFKKIEKRVGKELKSSESN